MVQQHLPVPPEGPEATRIGVPVWLTQPALQQDVFKELINKFAWAIGSTYRRTYTRRRSNVRLVAQEFASQLITQEGYPQAISK